MVDERPVTADIEDARLFSARLEVSDCPEWRPASLGDMAPLLALFARSRARQEAESSVIDIAPATESNLALDNIQVSGYNTNEY